MDTTNILQPTLATVKLSIQGHSIIWVYTTIILLIIVLMLLFLLFKAYSRIPQRGLTEKERIKAQILEGENVDMNNIIKSAFHAQPLYDQLKTTCHPDRFACDDNLQQKAEALFQEISQNKHNYKRLTELKQIAIETLNIKI